MSQPTTTAPDDQNTDDRLVTVQWSLQITERWETKVRLAELAEALQFELGDAAPTAQVVLEAVNSGKFLETYGHVLVEALPGWEDENAEGTYSSSTVDERDLDGVQVANVG